MRKSKLAFQFTVERLIQQSRCYFWTLTFSYLREDYLQMALFGKFINHLQKRLDKGWGGVRVVELHKHHGVHFHMVTNLRIAVDLIREVAAGYGIGRIDVRRIRDTGYTKLAGGAAVLVSKYLSKYLSKQRLGPVTQTGRQCRRWASFGDILNTRVCDIINECPEWVYRRAHALPFLGYACEQILSRCWLFGEETLKAAWFSMRQADKVTNDACAMAHGWLEVRGLNDWVWRHRQVEAGETGGTF